MLGLRLKLTTAVAYFVCFFDSPHASAADSRTAESPLLHRVHGLSVLTDSSDDSCQSCVATAIHPAMLLYNILSDPHAKTLLSDPGLRNILRNIKKPSPNKTSSIKSLEEELVDQIMIVATSMEEGSCDLTEEEEEELVKIMKEIAIIKGDT